MDSELDGHQVDRVVDLVRDVLGPPLVGVWLYGSALLGGLHHRSDVDLLAVTREPTTQVQRRSLVHGLLPLSGRGAVPRARSIELTVLVAADVRPWSYPPQFDFQYGDWLRDRFERGELEAATPPAPHPDVAILLTTALQGARPLIGPALADVVEPVPRPDLVAAMTDELEPLLADLEDDTANVLLTLARVVATLDVRMILPKDVAAERVLPLLSATARPALERARDVYLGTGPDEWDDLRSAVSAASGELADAIRRTASGAVEAAPRRS